MNVLIKLAILAALCFPAELEAQVDSPPKLLIIAADYSNSMNMGDPAHITIQTEALKTFFQNNPTDCGNVTVIFFPWSDRVWEEAMYTANLSDEGERESLVAGIVRSSTQASGGTTHSLAYRQALELFAQYPGHEQYLLVTTDEAGSRQDFVTMIPEAQVFAITYTQRSALYAEEVMVADVWNVSLAEDVTSVVSAITYVLNEIAMSVCVGM